MRNEGLYTLNYQQYNYQPDVLSSSIEIFLFFKLNKKIFHE
jgi:hypothetical protein